MRKYEVRKNDIEIPYKNRKDIKQGITMNQSWSDPVTLASCDSIEEAKKEFSKYESSIRELSGGAGKYYLVEEYYIEENEYDEDGDWKSGGDIWEFSKLPGIVDDLY